MVKVHDAFSGHAGKQFLDAPSISIRGCVRLSVRLSVRPSVHRSVGPSVGHTFVKIAENGVMQCEAHLMSFIRPCF